MFSACFSAPPRLRVKQHLSNSTRSRPRRNSRRLALSGRLRTAVARRIGKAWSAHRRVRNFCAILRAMRVCPPEYQHLHSRSPKHFRAILINTRKAIALPNPRVWFTARFHHFRGLQLHLFSPAFSAAKLAKPCSVTPTFKFFPRFFSINYRYLPPDFPISLLYAQSRTGPPPARSYHVYSPSN